ncbi:AraC family transcriptional regulator [Streptomyces sp. Agncl-13]|uniref:AraC family transcriptional regulator n=1 Tax=Streptomyces sp. Agncl-13 TaxID=3400628 RepID=UPI003A85AB50
MFGSSVAGAVPPEAGVIAAVGIDPSALTQRVTTRRCPRHGLTWAAQGVLDVVVDGTYWVLPPTRALWVPANAVHHFMSATRDTVLYSVYLEPERCPLDWAEPTPVAVGTLLGHLIRRLNQVDLTEDQRLRAEDLVPDLLYPVPTLLIKAPRPTDERVRAVADALLADPADRRSLEAHAQAVGVTGRTLMRLFADDTGMSFGSWRTCVRLQAALPLLVEGRSVSRVACDVGYTTPSAFLVAFRRVVGTSPGRYLNGRA